MKWSRYYFICTSPRLEHCQSFVAASDRLQPLDATATWHTASASYVIITLAMCGLRYLILAPTYTRDCAVSSSHLHKRTHIVTISSSPVCRLCE